ncbi:MAG: ABC transporter substrate-binding protein [Arcobacteraceae bacterium]|nr:ABC transporter substrate-binding protein [Arcobacteraceae bacterium]MDY0326833.1 ABC transporter substrate-binding protein [Arcobacteraceae bacterium]
MMIRIFLVIIVFFNFLFSNSQKQITVQLNWKYQFEFAGYIAAIEKGFYKEAGLDVVLKEYDNNVDVIGDVLSSNVDLGVYSSSLVEMGSKNPDLVLLANYFKRSALVIVSNQHIMTPTDLIGTKLMAGGFEIENSTLSILFKKFGIAKKDMELIPHTFKIDEFVAGEVDAMTAFVSNQLYFLQQKNISYNIIDPTNYGIFGFEHNLFSNKKFALKNQENIKKFIEATNLGWDYALNNPLEISQLIYQKYSKLKPIDALMFEANQIKKLMMPNIYPLGSIDQIALEKYVNDLKVENLIDSDFDVKEILFNYIITKEALFNNEQLEYLKQKKSITMCVDPAWMPYEKLEKGKHIGLAHEYFELFRSKLDIPIEVVQTTTWDESLQKAKTRECDILSLAVSTPQRREYMNFTKPYISYPLVIVTAMDKLFVTDVESIITQEKIGVVKGYAPYDIYSKKFPNHKMVQVDNLKVGLEMVRRGELYGFIDTLPTAGYEIQRNYMNELKIAGKFEDMWQLGIGVRNDDIVLLGIFNKLIDSISTEDAMAISNKWFAVVYEEKVDFKNFWQILGLIFVVMILLLYRQMQLKSYNTILNKQQLELQIAKEEVEKSLNTFKSLIDSTMESIIIFDKGVCIDVNIIAVETFGYATKKDMIGRSLQDLVSSESIAHVKEHFGEDVVFPYEILALKKDGSSFPALVQGRFLELAGKRVRISTVVDLSELKQRDNLLFQQSKMASMGEMIGNIAHQWRQPLSVISTVATGLKFQIEFDKLNYDEAIKDLDNLNESAQYLSKTIDDFRNFFKTNKEKIEFNVSEIIKKDINLLASTFKNHFITLRLDLDNDLVINGFRNELTQALLNVLSNAKDAIVQNCIDEDDRIIVIKSYRKNEQIVIEIQDSAGGIPSNIIDKIFEPYFTTKHQAQGTGIGLYMTYQIIVKNFGGSIKVRNKNFDHNNKNYNGANFKLFLPYE